VLEAGCSPWLAAQAAAAAYAAENPPPPPYVAPVFDAP
jgi:hypothetical protein